MKNKVLMEGIKDWIDNQIENKWTIDERTIKKGDLKINIANFLNDIENQTDKGIEYKVLRCICLQILRQEEITSR